MRTPTRAALLLSLLSWTCTQPAPTQPQPTAPQQVEKKKPSHGRLLRYDFNQRALAQGLPFFWRADVNADKALQPEELAVLWTRHGDTRDHYVDGERFTPAFEQAYDRLSAAPTQPAHAAASGSLPGPSLPLPLVQPTLLETDFSASSKEEIQLARRLSLVGAELEKLRGEKTSAPGQPTCLPAPHEALALALEAAEKEASALSDKPLAHYLHAAAAACRSNRWAEADAAWEATLAPPSNWYVRLEPSRGPSDACGNPVHLGFQWGRRSLAPPSWLPAWPKFSASFASAVAKLTGPAHRAQKIQWPAPEWVDLSLAAGSLRPALGASLAQQFPQPGAPLVRAPKLLLFANSLPQPETERAWRTRLASLLCAPSMSPFKDMGAAPFLAAALREAAQQLGPAGVELLAEKAQLGPWVLLNHLAAQKSLPGDLLEKARLAQLVWTFEQLALSAAQEGGPSPAGAAASSALASLWKSGGLKWKGGLKAANEADAGCFDFDDRKWTAATASLLSAALASGAAGRTQALLQEFNNGPGDWSELRAIVVERFRQVPLRKDVYSLRFEAAPATSPPLH